MNSLANQPVLAIETSCDDTCAAVTRGAVVLANEIISQTALHQPYGGVFPTVAKIAHREAIMPAITTALQTAGVTVEEIAAIAVTQGPGIAPSLEVGIAAAKALARKHQKPLIPLNHIEGHVVSVLAVIGTDAPLQSAPLFPALSLVISGGHSDFILVEAIGQYKRIGWSIDDAAGEALDKFGRALGLGYPAGATIERLALTGNPQAIAFPLPMTKRSDFHLSFAGLKTAGLRMVAHTLNEQKITEPHQLPEHINADLCASFQHSVFRHITYKLAKILQQIPDIQEIWLGGGVAANQTLTAAVTKSAAGLPVRTPASIDLCRDNAAMIGVAAGYHQDWLTEEAIEKVERIPDWELGD